MTIPRPTPWGWYQIRNILLGAVVIGLMAVTSAWSHWWLAVLAVGLAANGVYVWAKHLGPEIARIRDHHSR